jgi:hypothetical protein
VAIPYAFLIVSGRTYFAWRFRGMKGENPLLYS